MNIYSIYKATNIITNKSYIGFDSKWPKRKFDHKTAAKYHKKNNKFYNSIQKYGWDSFFWDVIYQSTDKFHCLKTMEIHFINEYNTLIDGYNSTNGGDGGLGNLWWNNGIAQVFTPNPPDTTYIRGRLPFNNTGAKIGSDIQRNKIWVNNGISEVMVNNHTIPFGYKKGRLKHAFNKSIPKHTAKGSYWWNNGENEKMSILQPGPAFERGRLKNRNRIYHIFTNKM